MQTLGSNPPANIRQTVLNRYGSRGARAFIYDVTTAAAGIDLMQPLTDTTDRRRVVKWQN